MVKILFEIDLILFVCFLHNIHGILETSRLAVVVKQLFTQDIVWHHVVIDVACINSSEVLPITEHFHHSFIILLKSFNVTLYCPETLLEVVNLIIKIFIMLVNSNFSVNQSVYTFLNFLEILIIKGA